VASNVVFAWIVTLPAPALFGWLFYELGNFVFYFSASARLALGRSLMQAARAAATVTAFATTVMLYAATRHRLRLARGRALAYSRLKERRYSKPLRRRRYQSAGEARCALY
jgi:hypothetical protein